MSARPSAEPEVPAPLFTLTGRVVPGKRLGTQLGFPTANLRFAELRGFPPNGVYVATATVRGRAYASVLNQGRHPTAPDGPPTIEAHLLDYSGGALYGETLTLRYERFLRPEERFPSLEALREQLRRDRAAAAQWAREQGRTAPKEEP